MLRLAGVIGVFLMGAVCLATGVKAESVFPLQQGNRFPALFKTLTPSPDSPDLPLKTVTAFVALDYSSIFIEEDTEQWEAVVDLEYTTVSLSLEARVEDLFSVKIETPFVAMRDGFLDGFLAEYHALGNFPDYGRSKRPNNEFEYYIRQTDGPFWYQATKRGLEPADSKVSVKVPLTQDSWISALPEHSFNSALKYSLKIPTGNKAQGLGSGGYDHGLFYLTRFTKNKFTWFVSPGFILTGNTVTDGAPVALKNMVTLFLGASYAYNSSLSLSAQLNCFSAPYSINISAFDYPGMELTLGARYRVTKHASVEIAFSEDLIGSVPDFSVHSGWQLAFW